MVHMYQLRFYILGEQKKADTIGDVLTIFLQGIHIAPQRMFKLNNFVFIGYMQNE